MVREAEGAVKMSTLNRDVEYDLKQIMSKLPEYIKSYETLSAWSHQILLDLDKKHPIYSELSKYTNELDEAIKECKAGLQK
ncbi:MAG: hypothetical protein LBH74_02470 [Nitrososphaerota archaeon]|jgi:hypothetical protein|nr:hypothetical protein [Nitrososphaerota archaeon]